MGQEKRSIQLNSVYTLRTHIPQTGSYNLQWDRPPLFFSHRGTGNGRGLRLELGKDARNWGGEEEHKHNYSFQRDMESEPVAQDIP